MRSAVLATLRGHPLAGAVRFLCEQRGDCVRFEVQIYDRASNPLDWLAMRTVGDTLQSETWNSLVEAMIRESGGIAPRGLETSEKILPEDQAGDVENWIRDLVVSRRRDEERKTA